MFAARPSFAHCFGSIASGLRAAAAGATDATATEAAQRQAHRCSRRLPVLLQFRALQGCLGHTKEYPHKDLTDEEGPGSPVQFSHDENW